MPILPIDSEHSAIFQCMQNGQPSEVARIILTASGGPFRKRPLGTFDSITIAEALAPPDLEYGTQDIHRFGHDDEQSS